MSLTLVKALLILNANPRGCNQYKPCSISGKFPGKGKAKAPKKAAATRKAKAKVKSVDRSKMSSKQLAKAAKENLARLEAERLRKNPAEAQALKLTKSLTGSKDPKAHQAAASAYHEAAKKAPAWRKKILLKEAANHEHLSRVHSIFTKTGHAYSSVEGQ